MKMDIQKNSLERIRIQRSEYKGHELIDIRVYYEAENGEWKPSKKGITFSLSLANEVIKGISEESKNYKE
jgi:hypothetical protein